MLFSRSIQVVCALLLTCALTYAASAEAQTPETASVRIRVRSDSSAHARPLDMVTVRSGSIVRLTDRLGDAKLQLSSGAHTVTVARLGFIPDTLSLQLRSNADTTIVVVLRPYSNEMHEVVVTATRSERRVEDTPVRIEVLNEEEIGEKVAMSPGDIAMMLNETSGLRVQTTNPSLGGANVRIQGLRGRYTLMLTDGLPLYGAQTGGLGLLQIPPVDLGRVEIIKGSASALYGSSALGGVIDLVSRRPSDESERTLLLNQTSRGGSDFVFFGSGNFSEQTGATLLAGAHTQRQNDIDTDGWTDMPGFTRYLVRPRIFLNNGKGTTAFLTAGYTGEDRRGGTIGNNVTPAGTAHRESLRTDRGDIGVLVRTVVSDTGSLLGLRALRSSVLTVRGSGVQQQHSHEFGLTVEDDKHRTWFGEMSLAVPRGRSMYVGGIAFQQEQYSAEQITAFDYRYNIPSAFLQFDYDATSTVALSASVRADAHSEYGTLVNPRLSLLWRAPFDGEFAGWNMRVSGGTGAFAPTPLIEDVEVTGLTLVQPLRNLVAERAVTASADVGGPVQFSFANAEFNATVFGSTVRNPIAVAYSESSDDLRMTLYNAFQPVRTFGGELLARFSRELGSDDEHSDDEHHDSDESNGGDHHEAPVARITASYTLLRSSECASLLINPDTPIFVASCNREDVALNPRHSAALVATIEKEGHSRVGLEVYYTGAQRLERNPYRDEGRPYVIVGLLAERAFETRAGIARVFVNFENITNVRQTRHDSLLLPSQSAGGRWTTDAWTDLQGFTVNGGVRWSF